MNTRLVFRCWQCLIWLVTGHIASTAHLYSSEVKCFEKICAGNGRRICCLSSRERKTWAVALLRVRERRTVQEYGQCRAVGLSPELLLQVCLDCPTRCVLYIAALTRA